MCLSEVLCISSGHFLGLHGLAIIFPTSRPVTTSNSGIPNVIRFVGRIFGAQYPRTCGFYFCRASRYVQRSCSPYTVQEWTLTVGCSPILCHSTQGHRPQRIQHKHLYEHPITSWSRTLGGACSTSTSCQTLRTTRKPTQRPGHRSTVGYLLLMHSHLHGVHRRLPCPLIGWQNSPTLLESLRPCQPFTYRVP